MMSKSSKLKRSDSDTNRNDSEKFHSVSELPVYAEEKEGECGYGSCEPKFLQCCNNAKGFLVVFFFLAIVQGMLVNGFINVSISTLEKRFGFKSSETGVMAVGFDIGFCLITTFVTYFGARHNRPRIVGIGAIVMGFGAMLFWLPHFTTPMYEYSTDGFNETCSDEAFDCNTDDMPSNLRYYIWVFIAAQLLHGFGATPLYTLGISYIEDSVPKKSSPLYFGIANAATILGPGLGYGLGGALLEVYVEFDGVSPDEIKIDSTDPRWVGAWWLGMMACMIFAFLLSIPLFGFPKVLPGTARYKARDSEVQGSEVEKIVEKKNFGNSIKDFPASLLILLKNPPYILCTLASCTEAMVISGFSSFLPKIIENQFRQTAGTAAIAAGLIGIPGGIVGHLLAGILVNRLNMKTANIYKFNVFYCLLVCATVPSLFLHCPNIPVAGVTVPYENSGLAEVSGNLTSACNAQCNCQGEYYIPVCGADDVTYFTACHAGCSSSKETNGTTYFFDCSCVNGTSAEGWQAKEGQCETNCANLGVFLAIFFFSVLFNCMAITPALVATFRVVPPNMKTFAIGVQWLIIRPLGMIPAPILFGTIIDLTCILWQTRQCDGTKGSCWIYDSSQMAINVLSITIACKLVSAILFFAAFWFYKPPVTNKEEELKEQTKFVNEAFTNTKTSQDDNIFPSEDSSEMSNNFLSVDHTTQF